MCLQMTDLKMRLKGMGSARTKKKKEEASKMLLPISFE